MCVKYKSILFQPEARRLLFLLGLSRDSLKHLIVLFNLEWNSPARVFSLVLVETPAAVSTNTFFNTFHVNWKTLQRKAEISQMGKSQVAAARKQESEW